MMSVATETHHQTSSEVHFITAMSESGSEASKVAKKRSVVLFSFPPWTTSDQASGNITAMPSESFVGSRYGLSIAPFSRVHLLSGTNAG